MTMQARVLRRKKWFMLDDAAKWISAETGEDVNSRDVAQFALEGELRLYVYLDYMYGKKLIPVGSEKGDEDAKLWGLNQNYLETPACEVVDASQLKDLTGIFEVGVNTHSTRGMLLSWLQGYSQESTSDYNNDSWCVFDCKGDAWVVYDYGENAFCDLVPVYEVPKINTLMIPREDVEEFINSLGEGDAETLSSEGDELRSLEAFGILVELYASQHGPDYWNGARPKASRIVQDMLAAVPNDVTNMGDRKLKDHVGAAIKAWEAKKRS